MLIFVAFPLWNCCFNAASGQFPKQVKCNYPVFTSNVSCTLVSESTSIMGFPPGKKLYKLPSPGSNCTSYLFLWTELQNIVFLLFQSSSIKMTVTKTRNHTKHGVKLKTERPADFWNQFVQKPPEEEKRDISSLLQNWGWKSCKKVLDRLSSCIAIILQ